MPLKNLTKKLHLPIHHHPDSIKNEKGMLANAMKTIAMEPFQLSGEIENIESCHKFYEKQHSAPAGLEELSRQELTKCVEPNVSQIEPLTCKASLPLLKILPPTPDQSQNPIKSSPLFAVTQYNKPLYKTNNNFAALLASSSPPDHHRSSSELVPSAAATNMTTITDDRPTASPVKQQLTAGHARTESLSMKISQSPKIGDGSNNNSYTKDPNNGVFRRSSDSDLSITPKGM